MSDDQQIAIPENRPDDCSVEQPPKDDAASAACPVQSPKDDAACPVPALNYETKMSDVVLLSKDDDAASFAPVPNMDDGPASPPKEVASSASPSKEDANPASPLQEDAIRAPPPMEDITHSVTSPLPLDETVPLVPRVEPESSKANSLENTDGCNDGDQVKHEIKHETIDLGDDTYYYDDDKAIVVEDDTKVGFDRGLEPDRIVGATEVNGKLMFLIAWKNADVADLLESTVVYNKCPQLAIQFFEARLRYCPNK